jgi:hypothetical protein
MKIDLRKLTLSILFVCLSLIIFNNNIWAQDLDDVTISGRITDPNNAPIAGAAVTATLIETNVERTITTDEDGRFRIVELQPGIYKVRVSASGFGAKERVDLQTISGQNVQLNFSRRNGDAKGNRRTSEQQSKCSRFGLYARRRYGRTAFNEGCG